MSVLYSLSIYFVLGRQSTSCPLNSSCFFCFIIINPFFSRLLLPITELTLKLMMSLPQRCPGFMGFLTEQFVILNFISSSKLFLKEAMFCSFFLSLSICLFSIRTFFIFFFFTPSLRSFTTTIWVMDLRLMPKLE